MKYITHRRFKEKAICGDVNIPAMTVCDEKNGIITHNGRQLCIIISENAHQFFANDEDGNGMIRGKLTQRIIKKLSAKDKDYEIRWDKIWNDTVCARFKMREHEDHWLWNHEFYNAEIDKLEYIANLIGA